MQTTMGIGRYAKGERPEKPLPLGMGSRHWYQTLPHKPFPPLPTAEDRLPRPDLIVQRVDLPIRPERRVSGSRFRPEMR